MLSGLASFFWLVAVAVGGIVLLNCAVGLVALILDAIGDSDR